MGIEERRIKLNQIVRGWINYFKPADAENLLKELDKWLKVTYGWLLGTMEENPNTFEKLKKAGINEEQAWMWANTRKGYWRTAHSPILTKALTYRKMTEDNRF